MMIMIITIHDCQDVPSLWLLMIKIIIHYYYHWVSTIHDYDHALSLFFGYDNRTIIIKNIHHFLWLLSLLYI